MKSIKVYTTRVCPYCEHAKRLLKSLDLNYEEIGLDRDPELRAKLSEENGGWRTVPMIFVGEEFIGGFDDLKKLHDRGEFLLKVKS